METVGKKKQWFPGTRGQERMKRQSTENVEGREIILYDTIIVDTLSKPMEGTTPKVNSNVNHGLRVRRGQCRFLGGNKRTTLLQDVCSGGLCMWGDRAYLGTVQTPCSILL